MNRMNDTDKIQSSRSFDERSHECSSLSPSNQLKSINELPEKYRDVFSQRFQCFNQIQSSLFDLIFNGYKSLTICAPTASGKTVLLELAIVHELVKLESNSNNHSQYDKFHALYLAPLKAIVEEKCQEWQQRFLKFGLKCFALTSDTDPEDYNAFINSNYSQVNILLATPEKFDLLIRSHSDSRPLLRLLQLIMIDEIHILGDRHRGDVLEATITRIKSIRDNANNIVKILNLDNKSNTQNIDEDENMKKSIKNANHLRFIAVSATAPNVEDISAWLDIKNGFGIRVPADYRPVKLKKFVFGFDPVKSVSTSEYRFDIQLSYKLEKYIREYSSSKPVLVFCSTRRSVEFTAKILASSQITYFESHQQRVQLFYKLSNLTANETDMYNSSNHQQPNFKNPELKLTLTSGVAFYHSGLDYFDRRLLEQLFSVSLIPVLVSTSSLAMGVNLPAHLVIIKNTVQYNAGFTVEYDISQILQMIGRAGRPQFDTEAKAIILTKNEKKQYYESLLNTEKKVESNLFRSLAEQLTVEIVLKTVTNVNLAIDWICSTFLFIRIVKNPSFYGSDIPQGDFSSARPIIFNWCQATMNRLQSLGLIIVKENSIESTQLAKIVTHYGVSVATTEKLIRFVKSKFSLKELLEEMCNCDELFQDVILRVSEKKFLNELNKKIKFKFKNRFKTSVMKISCLIQAIFESLNIESCLYQDGQKAIRAGQRVSKCFIEIFYYLFKLKFEEFQSFLAYTTITKLDMHLETIVSASHLAQAFRTKMWYDSLYVVRQLPKIGPTYSSILVENGYTSFDKLVKSNPRQIEFCIKRNPPFGSFLIEEIKSLPKYLLSLTKQTDCNLVFDSILENHIRSKIQIEFKCILQQENHLIGKSKILKSERHFILLILGCEECDQIIGLYRINDKSIISSQNVFTQQIILIMTDFDREKDNDKITSKRPRKVDEKENVKQQNENSEIEQNIWNDEYINFVKQIENSFMKHSNNKNLVFHCSLRNQLSHTIKSFLISESFVGLDAVTKLAIQFGVPVQDISNKDSENPLFQQNFNEKLDEDSESDYFNSAHDEDYAELLDDYDEFVRNGENQYLNDDDEASNSLASLDFPDPSDSPTDLLLNENYLHSVPTVPYQSLSENSLQHDDDEDNLKGLENHSPDNVLYFQSIDKIESPNSNNNNSSKKSMENNGITTNFSDKDLKKHSPDNVLDFKIMDKIESSSSNNNNSSKKSMENNGIMTNFSDKVLNYRNYFRHLSRSSLEKERNKYLQSLIPEINKKNVSRIIKTRKVFLMDPNCSKQSCFNDKPSSVKPKQQQQIVNDFKVSKYFSSSYDDNN